MQKILPQKKYSDAGKIYASPRVRTTIGLNKEPGMMSTIPSTSSLSSVNVFQPKKRTENMDIDKSSWRVSSKCFFTMLVTIWASIAYQPPRFCHFLHIEIGHRPRHFSLLRHSHSFLYKSPSPNSCSHEFRWIYESNVRLYEFLSPFTHSSINQTINSSHRPQPSASQSVIIISG